MSRLATFMLFLALSLAAILVSADSKRRDPTRPGQWAPSAAAAADAPLPTLTSVLISDSRKLAVIDGQVLGVGETHGAFRVRRIEADHVVVSIADGSLVTLPLDPHNMTKEVR